jgi:hypothetical protein
MIIQRFWLSDSLLTEFQPLIQANAQAAGNYPLRDGLGGVQTLPLKHWSMRDNGKLVGYCSHLVADHPIYEQIWASCFAIYLLPDYRAHARRFILRIECDLASYGVDHVTYSSQRDSSLWKFLTTERMGYAVEEMVVGKRLTVMID